MKPSTIKAEDFLIENYGDDAERLIAIKRMTNYQRYIAKVSVEDIRKATSGWKWLDEQYLKESAERMYEMRLGVFSNMPKPSDFEI